MRLRIRSIEKNLDGALVYFSSPVGDACGRWIGSPPSVDQEYEVEFDIPETLRWGQDVEETVVDQDSIFQKEDGIRIIGEIASFDDDLVATVRLGNSLFLVGFDRRPPSSVRRIEIKTGSIGLFDVNI